jgi:hypothetical protein
LKRHRVGSDRQDRAKRQKNEMGVFFRGGDDWDVALEACNESCRLEEPVLMIGIV